MDLTSVMLLGTIVAGSIASISLLFLMQTTYKHASCLTRGLFATLVITFLASTTIHIVHTQPGELSGTEFLVFIGSALWFGWRALNETLVRSKSGKTNTTRFYI